MLSVTLAPPQRHGVLTVYPLTDTGAPEFSRVSELPYMLMKDAIEEGMLTVTEVGAGSVPEVVAVNSGDLDVLILDGEQLIGARQNRMTNRSIVVPARSEVEIPVSCMEQGRWRFTSRVFSSSPHYSPSGVRRHARAVEAGLAKARRRAAPEVLAKAQSRVWQEISHYGSTTGAFTPTGALDEIYEQKSPEVDDWVASFPQIDGQVGVLAFAGDRVLGMDVIGSQDLYAMVHERLVTGYIMDALASRTVPTNAADDGHAAAFLEQVSAAPRVEAPTVGRGTYRVLAEGVLGGELEDQSRLVHLSSFPVGAE